MARQFVARLENRFGVIGGVPLFAEDQKHKSHCTRWEVGKRRDQLTNEVFLRCSRLTVRVRGLCLISKVAATTRPNTISFQGLRRQRFTFRQQRL
jgi:hypothetical protein